MIFVAMDIAIGDVNIMSNGTINQHINESYQNIKNYLNEKYILQTAPELLEMCKHCESWCGKSHDYSECEGRMCFKFYLAYNYLKWISTYE